MKPNEVYVEIQLLSKHGLSLRQIAAEVGCAVNTVRRHLALKAVPKYERKVRRPTKLAAHEAYLCERQTAAQPNWIPASVLHREIVERGYQGGLSQLRAFMRSLRPTLPVEPEVRFETAMGEQLQVDWVEFRKGAVPLHAFCATMGYSRASYVEFVSDMKVATLIGCHERAFVAFGGVPRKVLFDNMKTVVIERDLYGDGLHRFHAGFLDYAKHSGFIIKLCQPYRAQTKGKVERFNGYLRRSFYVPLASRLAQSGLQLDVVTANAEVTRWLREVANERAHGTTQEKPALRMATEVLHLQALALPWRGDIAGARPREKMPEAPAPRPAIVVERIAEIAPAQHPLAVYEQLLLNVKQGVAA
ncbi:MAG: transposase [Marmoricola sp.]|nr:transposase [Marmoricola sp.]